MPQPTELPCLFTGTQVPSLDEVAFVNYTWGHRTSVQSNTLLTGTSSLVFEGGQLTSGIQKASSYPERNRAVWLLARMARYRTTGGCHQPGENGSLSFQITQPLFRDSADR